MGKVRGRGLPTAEAAMAAWEKAERQGRLPLSQERIEAKKERAERKRERKAEKRRRDAR